MQAPSTNSTIYSKIKASSNDWVLAIMLILISLLYGSLILNDKVPVLGWVVLAAVWLLFSIKIGRLSIATPMNLPVISLLALLPLSYFISVDLTLSIPKIHGLILGAVTFFLITNFINNYKRLHLAIFALVLMAVAVSILGLVGINWTGSRFSILNYIYDLFIPIKNLLPDLAFDNYIHVNTIGGALAFFLPLLVNLFFDRGTFSKTFLENNRFLKFRAILYKLCILVTTLFVILILALTQSRGAWIGSAVALLVLAIWKDHRFAWLIPVLIVCFIIIFFLYFDGNLNHVLMTLDAGEDNTIAGRLVSWRNTISMIQDFPLTGAGIGTYSKLFNELYFYDLFTQYVSPTFQPHNIFLAVAIDLGLPALILYVSLLTIFFYMAFIINRAASSIVKVLALGLACGMFAHQIFGITDSFLLGTKLGIIMWIYYGIMTALFIHFTPHLKPTLSIEASSVGLTQEPASKQRSYVFYHIRAISYQLIAWLLVSLISLSFVNINIYLSLSLAILGGILLGILNTKNFQLQHLYD